MSRPRKPEDPVRWPAPCARCRQHYQIVANWPDGVVCGYCYQQAKRTRGLCRCGHEGVLPGRIDTRPACRSCSGVNLNIDCRVCGAEDELYDGGRCWGCTLATTVDRLLADPSTGTIAPQLVPMGTALKSMQRANSGLTWIRQKHVAAFLRQLVIAPTVTHEAIDALPTSRTREFVRGLLVEHGILPYRDTYRARFDEWSRQALDKVVGTTNREVIRRYIRWQHQRRMNQMREVPQGTFLRSKQTVTVAIDFLNWLTERGVELGGLEQEHLDIWQTTGPSTRLIADRFLGWAIKARLARAGLTIQRHRRGGCTRLTATDQESVVERVVHTDELTPRDRAAAILVVVFGQQVEDVVGLTWDDIQITSDLVSIQVGSVQIALLEPLDSPWRALAADPGHDLTAAHLSSRWVFRGSSPGRHIDASHLRNRLRRVFSTRAARLGTLHELTKLAPIAILADALGYSPATIERHAVDSAAAYARYIGSIAEGTAPPAH